MPRSEIAVLLACCACTFGGGPGITPIRTAFNRGVYHQSRGDLDAALAEYRLALEEDARDHRARFNLAVTLESMADAADAATATGYRRQAEREYGTILELQPGDLRASVNLAALEWGRGDRESADARLRAAALRYPDVALPWTALAAHHSREGDLDGAAAAIAESLARDPSSVWANVLRGEILARQGDLEGARSAIHRALARDDEDLGALMALARLELRSGDAAAAIAALRRLSYVDPDSWRTHMLLYRALLEVRELEGAIVHLWAARDLDHQRPPSEDPPDYLGLQRELLTELLDPGR